MILSHACPGSNYLPTRLPVASNYTNGCKRNRIYVQLLYQDRYLNFTRKCYEISAINYKRPPKTEIILMTLLTFSGDVSYQTVTLEGVGNQVRVTLHYLSLN